MSGMLVTPEDLTAICRERNLVWFFIDKKHGPDHRPEWEATIEIMRDDTNHTHVTTVTARNAQRKIAQRAVRTKAFNAVLHSAAAPPAGAGRRAADGAELVTPASFAGTAVDTELQAAVTRALDIADAPLRPLPQPRPQGRARNGKFRVDPARDLWLEVYTTRKGAQRVVFKGPPDTVHAALLDPQSLPAETRKAIAAVFDGTFTVQ